MRYRYTKYTQAAFSRLIIFTQEIRAAMFQFAFERSLLPLTFERPAFATPLLRLPNDCHQGTHASLYRGHTVLTMYI